jgi:hypothetical protein
MHAITKRRLLILCTILATAGLVAIAARFSFRLFGPVPIRTAIKVEVERPPSDVTTNPTVTLAGSTDRPAYVELMRNDTVLATISTTENRFRFDDIPLLPGNNALQFSAKPYYGDPPRGIDIVNIKREPASPSPPLLNAIPATIDRPDLVVSGVTHPNEAVVATVERMAGGQPVPDRTPIAHAAIANNDGKFEVNLTLNEAGEYCATAVAMNSDRTTSLTSPPVPFRFDPFLVPPATASVPVPEHKKQRKATIFMSHKSLTIAVEVTLAKNDPAVLELMKDHGNIEDFVDHIFRLKFNGSFYSGFFKGSTPQITLTDKTATVIAASNPQRPIRDVMPVLNGVVTISGAAGFPLADDRDCLNVVIADYTVKTLSPQPSTFANNQAVWLGDPTANTEPEVKVALTYNPFSSPRSFFRLLQLGSPSLGPYPVSAIPGIWYGLLSLVPLLWLMCVAQQPPYGRYFEQLETQTIYRFGAKLIAVSLVVILLEADLGIAYLLYNFKRLDELGHFTSSREPLLFFPFLVLFFLLIWPVRFLLRRFWPAGGDQVRAMARGARGATGIMVIVCLFYYAAYYSSKVTTLVLGTFLIAFCILFYLHYYTQKLILPPPPGRRRPLRNLVMAAGVIALLTVPTFRNVSEFDVLGNLSTFFYVVRDLTPYLVAVCLILLLRRPEGARWKEHIFALNLGLILFAGFLIGATPNLLMLPLPFLLAIWAYRRFLLAKASDRQKLGEVAADIIARRRYLIESVLANDAAQEIRTNWQQMKAKVISGDMELSEFESRKEQIMTYAAAQESASTLKNGLAAKDVVLSIGPERRDWRNGTIAVRKGSILMLPFLIAYGSLLLLRGGIVVGEPFPLLTNVSSLLTFVADWLIAAFFFGYFFNYIKGDSGIQKGLRIACVIILCLLPAWFSALSAPVEFYAVVLRAGQTLLFFMLLGLWAFDYRTFRDTLKSQFTWKSFSRFGDMTSFTAVVSVLLTSVGVGITTVLTGQFKDLLVHLIGAAVNAVPGTRP